MRPLANPGLRNHMNGVSPSDWKCVLGRTVKLHALVLQHRSVLPSFRMPPCSLFYGSSDLGNCCVYRFGIEKTSGVAAKVVYNGSAKGGDPEEDIAKKKARAERYALVSAV